MSFTDRIWRVLNQKHELVPKDYDFLIECLTKEPDSLYQLAHDTSQDSLAMFLAGQSDRLTRLFQRIKSTPPSLLTRTSRRYIAEQLVLFLLEVLPTLSEILEEGAIAEFLTPALAICLEQKPVHFQKLANHISISTLQNLFADESSGCIVRGWAMNAQKSMPRDAVTLQRWTTALSSMVELCTPNCHGVNYYLELYKTSKELTENLLEHSCQFDTATRVKLNLPKLDAMIVLNKDDKKSDRTKAVNVQSHYRELGENVKASLSAFDLEAPHSIRTLQQVIQQLKIEKTLDILSAIAATFPCGRCKKMLAKGYSPLEPHEELPKPEVKVVQPTTLSLDVFGKQIGAWKVLLSQVSFYKSVVACDYAFLVTRVLWNGTYYDQQAALKSLQTMDHHVPIKSKLIDLTSMCAIDCLTGSPEQRRRLRIPLTTTECGKDRYILWQIDVGVAEGTGLLRQEVKVWDIGSREEISKAIEHVIALQQNYSDEVVRLCCQRQKRKQGEHLLPVQFDQRSPITQPIYSQNPVLDVRLVSQETIDMANKFYALTKPVLQSLVTNNMPAQVPFDLSAEEAEIIQHFKTSTLILGRSGTGKTTCLVYKLVAKYLAGRMTGGEPIQQVLLTRSSLLAEKLRNYTVELIKTLDMSSHEKDGQLGLTEPSNGNTQWETTTATALDLSEVSFPLICTFDHFLQVLENTITAMDRQSFERGGKQSSSKRSGLDRATWEVVDRNSFRLDYWPRFPSPLTKRLPLGLVFSEIMGVIKGSASSRTSLTYLSRDEYLTRSTRLAPAFSAGDRPLVYEIFEVYENLKYKRREMDYVDRVMKVLRAIRVDNELRRLLGCKFHEMYIDEVQDQRMMDLEMFLSFVNDSRGFHFAGDTAQAIAGDSTFRFEDVSALIYNHFAAAGATMNQLELVKPTMFKLAKNYRSHRGILQLASLIMSLLWKGFPDTVDKLGPEIGQLAGPTPTIFLGCGADLLTSTNVGRVQLSGNSGEFGAEQVILVRDDAQKKILQAQIGDAALVLTILQSKGMEFDDVILWDFFSNCPNETGVRNLGALLKPETASGYAREHTEMCSELKTLYVAVTRARVQLYLIESSSKIMQPVIDLIQGGGQNPVVDVTSPADDLFEAKLRSLRPGQIVDPRRWSLRGEQFIQASNFTAALFCFRKAQDTRGTMRAQANLYAEDGRTSKASGDVKASMSAFEAARELYMELNCVVEAALMLEYMDRFGDAAELWREQGSFGKAANLFCLAESWTKAAECHECDGDYETAASVLHRGKKYDDLILYLSRNQTKLEAVSLQRFIRLAKLLLKQAKITSTLRKEAIGLLGSVKEQESCLREYDMHTELMELYTSQQRYADVFLLYIQAGRLTEALETVLTYNLAFGGLDITENQLLRLLDYVITEQAAKSLKEHIDKQFVLPVMKEGALTDNMIARLQQWTVASRCIPWRSSSTSEQDFESIVPRDLKLVVSLLNIRHPVQIAACSEVADLPYKFVHEAINAIKEVFLKDSDDAKSVFRLVIGLQPTVIASEADRPLPWAISQNPEDVNNRLNAARADLLKNFGSIFQAFESKAQQLWKEKNPRHCAQFLARGFCFAQQRGECHPQLSHRPVTSGEYAQNTTDLLRIVDMICQLNGLYYRRVLSSDFSSSFLPMKRRWLEPFIRQLTYISALEQDFSVLATQRLEVACGSISPAIISSLEDLLFVHLRQEWEMRRSYSAVLEESQFAEIMGIKVLSRFYRALSYKLSSEEALRQIRLPALLKSAGSRCDIVAFESLLRDFVGLLQRLSTDNLTSLYSVITEVESVATFLISRICSTACLVPQSWLNANSWISGSNTPLPQLDWPEKVRLTMCLFRLTGAFCEVLGNLERNPPPSLGLVKHPDLLRQRNAQYLAVVVVNIATHGTRPSGFGELWATVTKTLRTFYCNAVDYKGDIKTIQHLRGKLSESFKRYAGKDSLVLLTQTPQHNHAFTEFQGLKSITFDEFRTLSVPHAAVRTSGDESSDEKTTDDTAAVTKIQKFWRKWYPRYRHHQEYLKSANAQIIAKYISLGCKPLSSLQTRALLVTAGPELHFRLISAKNMFFALRKQILWEMKGTEDADDRCDVLDAGLHQLTMIESQVDQASKIMSDDHVRVLVAGGVALAPEDAFNGVRALIEEATSSLHVVKCTIEVLRK